MESTKKDVLINIKGISVVDGEQDVIELFTTGHYSRQDDAFVITYDETEATGFEGSQTTLEVWPTRVVMQRIGQASSQLVIEQGVRHQCHYNVGVGEMMIGVSGRLVKNTLTERGGNLYFAYALDINSMEASENEMYIHVEENAPSAERTEKE